MKTMVVFALGMMVAGRVSAQPAKPAPKTAGEAYKNVTVLRDVPDSEWGATMQFMSGSLGVTCEYCHAQPFDSDAREAKVTARRMIRMTRELNAASFGGRPVVTCNTCHQGSTHPNGTPSLWNKTPEQIAAIKKEQALNAERAKAKAAGQPAPAPAPAVAAPAKNVEGLPDVDQVLARYRKAVSGDGVKSIHLAGTMSGDLTPTRSLEAYMVFPDKFAMAFSAAGIEAKLVLNGDRGWTMGPQGKADFHPERVAQARDGLSIFAPDKVVASDASRKVIGIEKMGDRTCVIVESTAAKRVSRLYFDMQTGLLYKVHLENGTALGPEPSEMTFEGYRDSNGVKMPASMVVVSLSDRLVYRFTEIQANLAVDAAKFEPPAASK